MGTKLDKLLQFLLRRETVAEPDGRVGHAESPPIRAPNQGVQLTAYSLRSCVAPAFGSS